ncbi:MAG: hypothetical protein H0W25_07540 [Acidimicrobiia bacterium]|nr:hypothetical protein [Acidimicrobiia bacterium]
MEVIQAPDGDAQADAANGFGADVFVGLVVRPEPGVTCAFYERDDFSSIGGRRLAGLVLEHLAAHAPEPPAKPHGMRLPVLRATKMPAVVVELGDPKAVVAQLPIFATAIAAAVTAWTHQPV